MKNNPLDKLKKHFKPKRLIEQKTIRYQDKITITDDITQRDFTYGVKIELHQVLYTFLYSEPQW